MNLLKKIVLTSILVFLFSGTLKSQTKVPSSSINYEWLNGGVVIHLTFSVDSVGSYITAPIDISAFDAQTIYLLYDYITPGATLDSLRTYIRGVMPGATPNYTVSNIYAPTNMLDTLGLFVAASTTNPRQVAISNTTFYTPYIQIFCFPTRADIPATRDGTVYFALYAPAVDVVPPFMRWGQRY